MPDCIASTIYSLTLLPLAGPLAEALEMNQNKTSKSGLLLDSVAS